MIGFFRTFAKELNQNNGLSKTMICKEIKLN